MELWDEMDEWEETLTEEQRLELRKLDSPKWYQRYLIQKEYGNI